MESYCKQCQFYLPDTDMQGICRRYPPSLTLENIAVRKGGKETEMTSAWQFPRMMAHGWCGEYKLKIVVQ